MENKQSAEQRSGWWDDPFRMFQTNLREIDAGTLDVEATLDFLEEFGADTWLLNTGGIVSNYPTRLDAQRRNPTLDARPSGDLLRDATRGAAARGIRVLSRMDFSKVDPVRASANPEWLFVDAEGAPQIYNGLYSVCPSGDYFRSVVPAVLQEVIDGYDVAGYFFNAWSFSEYDYSRRYRGVCQCDACRRGFGAFAPGAELPHQPGDPTYDAWTAYAARTLDDLAKRVRSLIAERAPSAAYLQGVSADISFHEANNAIGRTLWHHRTADEISALTTRDPGKPSLVHAVCFVDMPYRWAGEDTDHFAQHLIQGFARGANPSTYVMGPATDSAYECLEVARELTSLHAAHAAAFEDYASAAPVLLVRPDRHTVGTAALDIATEEYQGVHEMLVGAHVGFDVLDARHLADRDASLPALSRWSAIVLPDLAALGPTVSTRLTAYVEGGGTLITTASTHVGRKGAPLAPPVRGAIIPMTDENELLSYHVAPRVDGGDLLAALGALYLADADADADAELPILGPAPFGPPEKCYGHRPTGRFARLTRSHGAGRVVSYLWSVGRAFRATGAARLQAVVAGSLRSTLSPATLAWASSPALELMLGTTRTRRVCHLLNRSGDRGRYFTTVSTMRGESVILPWPGVTEVHAAVAGLALSATPHGGGISVQLPMVGRYELLTAASE